MVNMELRAMLPEDALVFDNFSFDGSIIGVSYDGRVVYDYEKMVEELVAEEGLTYEEAADYVSYDTARAASYLFHHQGPIIMYPLMYYE